jgi:hypothetical protein
MVPDASTNRISGKSLDHSVCVRIATTPQNVETGVPTPQSVPVTISNQDRKDRMACNALAGAVRIAFDLKKSGSVNPK